MQVGVEGGLESEGGAGAAPLTSPIAAHELVRIFDPRAIANSYNWPGLDTIIKLVKLQMQGCTPAAEQACKNFLRLLELEEARFKSFEEQDDSAAKLQTRFMRIRDWILGLIFVTGAIGLAALLAPVHATAAEFKSWEAQLSLLLVACGLAAILAR